MSSGSSLSINNERFLQPLPPSPHRYTSAAGYSKVAHLLEAPISVQAPQFAYTKKKEKQKHDAAGVIKECLNETTLHQMRAFISRWKVEEETRKSSSLLLLLLFVEMHFSELPRLRSFFWFCDVVSCTPLPSVFFFFYVYKKKGQVCCSSMLSLASRQQWPTIAVTKAGGSLNLGSGQRQTAASRPIGRRRKNAS